MILPFERSQDYHFRLNAIERIGGSFFNTVLTGVRSNTSVGAKGGERGLNLRYRLTDNKEYLKIRLLHNTPAVRGYGVD